MNKFKKSLIELLTFITVVNLAGCTIDNNKSNDNEIGNTITNALIPDVVDEPCNILEPHGHAFIHLENGVCEFDECKKLYAAKDTHKIDIITDVVEFDLDLINFINSNGLVSIPNNLELLQENFPVVPSCLFYEYEYDLKNVEAVPNGKGGYDHIESSETKINWSDNLSEIEEKGYKLTGNTAEIVRGYRGYQLFEYSDVHDFYLEESPIYGSLEELIDAGYTFINFDTFCLEVLKSDLEPIESMELKK